LRTGVALYDTNQQANEAIQDLLDHQFSRDRISLITHPQDTGEIPAPGDVTQENLPAPLKPESRKNLDHRARQGAGLGAAVGGAGGILFSLVSLLIPGLGPVLATGPLIVALSGISGAGIGAIAGASAGGFIAALNETGLTTEQASAYLEGLRQGKVLVAVQTENADAESASQILKAHHPVGIGDHPEGTDIFPSKKK
jgi:hypothetical protein